MKTFKEMTQDKIPETVTKRASMDYFVHLIRLAFKQTFPHMKVEDAIYNESDSSMEFTIQHRKDKYRIMVWDVT